MWSKSENNVHKMQVQLFGLITWNGKMNSIHVIVKSIWPILWRIVFGYKISHGDLTVKSGSDNQLRVIMWGNKANIFWLQMWLWPLVTVDRQSDVTSFVFAIRVAKIKICKTNKQWELYIFLTKTFLILSYIKDFVVVVV